MLVNVPEYGLIVLIGASGSGKSTFAQRFFRPTEILASDHYRGIVGDDERSRRTSRDAFDVIEQIAARRLNARRLTVIDATNLQRDNRRRYIDLSRAHHAPLTAIVFDLPEKQCQAHNQDRGDKTSPTHVVRRHCRAVKQSLKTLSKEGYRRRYRLRTAEEVENATMEREPLSCDARDQKGPFDIIGDVHGCLPELRRMLEKLNYEVTEPAGPDTVYQITPPEGRTAIFVGDLVRRIVLDVFYRAKPLLGQLAADIIENRIELLLANTAGRRRKGLRTRHRTESEDSQKRPQRNTRATHHATTALFGSSSTVRSPAPRRTRAGAKP